MNNIEPDHEQRAADHDHTADASACSPLQPNADLVVEPAPSTNPVDVVEPAPSSLGTHFPRGVIAH